MSYHINIYSINIKKNTSLTMKSPNGRFYNFKLNEKNEKIGLFGDYFDNVPNLIKYFTENPMKTKEALILKEGRVHIIIMS